jgi:AcrR family transcriptional regulator
MATDRRKSKRRGRVAGVKRKPGHYHHGELREALVAAGRTLLEQRGRQGFTLRECARRARVSHAAPAHHFRSAGDLLAEIAARGFDQLSAEMDKGMAEAAQRGDSAELFAALGRGYVRFALEHKAVFLLMFNGDVDPGQNERLGSAARAAYLRLTHGIEKLMPGRSADAKQAVADLAWASVHGFAMLLLGGQLDPSDPAHSAFDRRLDSLLEGVLGGIKSR